MTRAFADTSHFLALLIPGDPFHEPATAWASRSNRRLVTTEYVVMEVGNYLSGSRTRHLFSRFIGSIRSNSRLDLIAESAGLLHASCDLYIDRGDKTWSLTDCSSFIVMRALGLSDVLTSDIHFRQAGFNALLLP